MTTPSLHHISSEIAYDLLQEHMNTVLALLNQPLSKQEVIAQVGSEATVDRMLKHGLITLEGHMVHAVAGLYHQLRREGMMSFLERYLLPSINANTVEGENSGIGFLANLFLKLPSSVLKQLRNGPVDSLINQLSEISDRPTEGNVHRLTVLVLGTSTPADDNLPMVGEDTIALENLRCTAMQRASSVEKEQAIMIQFDCLADKSRYFAATEAAELLIDSLKSYETPTDNDSISESNYRLTVATHWQCISHTNASESRQLC